MQYIITSAITLILLIAQPSPGSRILGKWQTVEETDGLGSILEFRKDGLFSTTFRLISEGTYKVEGGRILRSGLKPGRSQEPEVIEFRIEGARLVLKTSEVEMALTRLGEARPGGPAIVGKWGIKEFIFPHRHGGEKASLIYEFTEDGQFRAIIQGEPEARKYRMRGKWLTMRIDGESRRVKYRFEDGVLVLESYSEGGREKRYRRIEQ